MTVALSITVFTAIILLLTFALIVAEKKLTPQGDVTIKINGEKELKVAPGSTLLSTLSAEKIFIPSACGGGGTCAMCKCQVLDGGGEILATEKTHVNRREEKNHVRLACQVKVRDNMEIAVPEEIFGIKRFTGTVESNDNVATFIKATNITIDDGKNLDFKAGGYIQFEVPPGVYKSKDFVINDEYKETWDQFKMWDYSVDVPEGTFRAYSMANHPAEGNKVMTTIRFANPPPGSEGIPAGKCSSWIFSLNPGDKVTFSGPYGEFFINENSKREMCYIGGGAGMAPMRSHLFHLFHTMKTDRKVNFFYGARSMKENFYEEDFTDIEQKFDNFKYNLALSDPQPEDNWTGPTGFIHLVAKEYLEKHEDPTEIEYYLCGPPMMIDAVIDMLHEFGVEDDMIRYDKF